MKRLKTLCAFLVVLVAVFEASLAFAWICGDDNIDRGSGKKDLRYVMVDYNNNRGSESIVASILFTVEEAAARYRPMILIKREDAQATTIQGEWSGRNDIYLGSSGYDGRPFNARFIIKTRSHQVYYDSGWLTCQ